MGRVYSPYIRGKGPGRAPANPLSRGAYVATIDLGRILFLALIFLCASLPSVQLRAQPNTTTSSSYLLIVETSRAMQPRARAVYDSIKEILDSNFKGQLREGDKFGIWTFSDTLDTGYMPLAAWSSDTHLTSAMRAGRFSQTDTYANRPSLDKVVPELNRLLLQPGSVTVLLYTTGKNDLHGTALDDQLNATFKEWQDQ